MVEKPKSFAVVVGERDYLEREGIAAALEEVDGVRIAAVAWDADSLRSAVVEHRPDLVVTAIRLQPTQTDEGVRIAEEFAATDPALGVVLLTHFAVASYAQRFFASGNPRRAYVLKERIADSKSLRKVLEMVASGQPYLDPEILDLLVRPKSARAQLETLTPREREVLAYVAKGASNAAIARQLVVTIRAVERHINAIFDKLELREAGDRNRRVMAARLYVQESSDHRAAP